MKKISIEVPEALDREVRVLAAQLDIDRSKFARLALQEKVARLNEEVSQLSSTVDALTTQAEARHGLPVAVLG